MKIQFKIIDKDFEVIEERGITGDVKYSFENAYLFLLSKWSAEKRKQLRVNDFCSECFEFGDNIMIEHSRKHMEEAVKKAKVLLRIK